MREAKTQEEVINGLRNGFAPQTNHPIVPQRQGQQPLVVVQQPPQMTPADYLLARTQLAFNFLPAMMPNPNGYLNQVLEQMDEYTSGVSYNDRLDIHIRED
jgi:hypothetical protein